MFVFDFDGVLTDNHVLISENGEEYVRCSRSDGLGFRALQKLGKLTYIMSTETNPVVELRARKLGVPCLQAVQNKGIAIQELCVSTGVEIQKIMFVGNDLNDYAAMAMCGFSACPADSHPRIKSLANVCLQRDGGDGVVFELVEEVFGIDLLKVLWPEREGEHNVSDW